MVFSKILALNMASTAPWINTIFYLFKLYTLFGHGAKYLYIGIW